MKIKLNGCQKINLALKLCLNSGNKVFEISEGWSNAEKVFHMSEFLSSNLKAEIKAKIRKLEYFKDNGSPQVPADEGFFCNECKEGISFPVKK